MEKAKKVGISIEGKVLHYSAGVIVECSGKYLLLDRKNPPFGFAAPAGHIDEGEIDPRAAALREVGEETGIIGEQLELVAEEEIPWNYCQTAPSHYWWLYRTQVDSFDVVQDFDEEKSIGWYAVEEMKHMELEPVWKYWFEKLGILN